MLDVLLVDDEPTIRLPVADALRAAGHRVTVASDGAAGLDLVTARVFDAVVTDVRLPRVDGLTLLRRSRAESPRTSVILITAFGTVADAVTALKEGADDYLTKPFDADELVLKLARIDERRALEKELETARAQLATRDASVATRIVGRSPVMVRLLERIDTIASSEAPVLIVGESGTGKELVARSLHEKSARRAAPFVAVNCAAFPESLIEAELFGHERGAFTGAVKKRDGRFRAAHGGTLFLDEIAEIPLPAQAKLLRVIQEGCIEPLGTNAPVTVDVRIVSATHRNLRERIAEGSFREDLYYRLNVLDVSIPPLRDRRGDLPILVEHVLQRLGGERPRISPRAWAALTQYTFPGNVRELEHALEHAHVLARGGEIDLEHLPSDVVRGITPPSSPEEPRPRPLAVSMKEFERECLLRALDASGGRKTRAAELLGISRKNLWEKLKAHAIQAGDAED